MKYFAVVIVSYDWYTLYDKTIVVKANTIDEAKAQVHLSTHQGLGAIIGPLDSKPHISDYDENPER